MPGEEKKRKEKKRKSLEGEKNEKQRNYLFLALKYDLVGQRGLAHTEEHRQVRVGTLN